MQPKKTHIERAKFGITKTIVTVLRLWKNKTMIPKKHKKKKKKKKKITQRNKMMAKCQK